MNIHHSMCHYLKIVTMQIIKIVGNRNATAVTTTNVQTIGARLRECSRLITLGQHTQIRNQM